MGVRTKNFTMSDVFDQNKNILFYSPSKLIKIYKNPKYGIFVKEAFKGLMETELISYRPWGCVDRTDTVNPKDLNFHIIDPLPKTWDLNKTNKFKDICDKLMSKLLNKTNGKIQIMWSGGIDSTVIVVALLKNASPSQLKNSEILLTKNSIKENTDFFKNHIKKQIKYKVFKELKGSLHKKNYLLVTGLFGNFISFSGYISHDENSHWFDITRETCGTRTAQLLIQQSLKCPIPIKTYRQMGWWVEFSFFWNAEYSLLSVISDFPVQSLYKIIHFYQHRLFQNFSIVHVGNNEQNLKTKIHLLHYIFDFTKNHQDLKMCHSRSLVKCINYSYALGNLNRGFLYVN